MLRLVEITPDLAGVEKAILNSDAFFNRVSFEREEITDEEIALEHAQTAELDGERYLVMDGGEYVGILDFIMLNPKDGSPWLGLLQVDKKAQGKGFGRRMLEHYIDLMKARKADRFRIGIIAENEPARKFWSRFGFDYVKTVQNDRQKTILVYEKRLG